MEQSNQRQQDQAADTSHKASITRFDLTCQPNWVSDKDRSAKLALGLAEHLDDLRDQLGERVRQKLGIDLWQAVRDGGQLKLVTETARGTFNTTYATVSGYRLIDPSRKKLAPTLRTAIKALDSIPYFDIASASDAERAKAARLFGKGLDLLREAFEDIEELRRFVSLQTTATIRNWSLQENAPTRGLHSPRRPKYLHWQGSRGGSRDQTEADS